MKGCICHFVKWQIHSFISKWTITSNCVSRGLQDNMQIFYIIWILYSEVNVTIFRAPFRLIFIVGKRRDREVACSTSDRQGSNFEFCVGRTVSSHSSHHPQEVLLAQFSLYVHKSGLKLLWFLLNWYLIKRWFHDLYCSTCADEAYLQFYR